MIAGQNQCTESIRPNPRIGLTLISWISSFCVLVSEIDRKNTYREYRKKKNAYQKYRFRWYAFEKVFNFHKGLAFTSKAR